MALVGNLSDIQVAQQSLQGLLEAVCTNPFDTANMLLEVDIQWVKAADDGAAATATAEFVLGWFPRRAAMQVANPTTNVTSNYVSNDATGLVVNASNFASLIFQSRNGAGGAAVGLGTTATSSGPNMVQWTNYPLTVVPFSPGAAGANVPAGGFLTFQITKSGTGVIVPAGTLTARTLLL